MNLLETIQAGKGLARSCRAIEIGTTAIRVVALKRRGKKVQIIEAREESLVRRQLGPPPPEALEEALRKLFGSSKLREEVLYSSLPLHKVFIRNLVIPFIKLTQIRQVIASEVELHVPFPLDQIVIDFWPVKELEGGKTCVTMVAVKKEVLKAHLDLLQASGLDPDAVSLDCLGLATAYSFSGLINPDEITMLLDIGAVHTGVALFFQGAVRYLRSFDWGGDTITAAIMEEMGCGFTEAEKMKTSSELEPSLRKRIQSAVGSTFTSLETEIIRTAHSSAPETGGTHPQNIILTGGTLGQEGLKQYLSRKIGLRILDINPFSKVDTAKQTGIPSGSSGSFGLALSAVTPPPAKINFRQGEFSFQGSWEALKRRLLITATLTAALIALLGAGLFLKINTEKQKYHRLGKRIQSQLEEAFPEAKVPAPGNEISMMKDVVKRVGEELEIYRGLLSLSALDILREISRIIPGDIRVQVVELEIDQERVRFRGRTDSFRSKELIENAFSRSSYFQADKIRKGEAKTKKKEGKIVTVEFSITVPLIPREI